MRFKRLAAAVMAATMCGSLLVGCGGSDNKSTDNNENITATIKVWGPAEAPIVLTGSAIGSNLGSVFKIF